MKKINSIMMLIAAAAIAFTSCQKQETFEPESAQEVTLAFASEKPAFADETKTEWNGETILWSEGDKISIAYTVNGTWQNASGDASGDARLYKSEALEAAAETAQFNVSTDFKGTTEGTYVFYGVYPAPSSTSFADAPVATLTVPSIQTPGATSFDGSADLMTGVSVGEFTSIPTETISMKWTRLVAHANITLKALNGVTAGETVSSIKLTAQEGANLVGSQKVNILTNEVTCNNDEANIVDLMGGNLSISAEGNIEFWACFLPTTLTSLKVEVETNKASYTREITGIEKTFKQNARNILSIKMDKATRVAKEEESWVLVTPADGLTEGTYVLVASTKNQTGALVSTNGSSSAPTFNTSISVSDNTLNGVTEAMQFDLSGTAGNYMLAVTGQTTNYLYTTATNNGVRVGTNANNVWTITQHESNADAFVFKCNATSRFLGVYNEADWRCYTAYDAANFTSDKGSSQIYLYKKQAGPVVPDTTPSVKLGTEELELTSEESEGTIEVNAKNIASIEVRALVEEGSKDNSDWLVAEYDEANSCVTYYAPANDSEEARTAYIEVYCLDADDNEVVAGVNVTQEGKVVVDTNFEEGDYWIIGVEDGTSRVMLPLASSASYGYASSEVITDNRTFAKNAFTFEAVEGGFNIKASDGRYYSTQEGYKSFQISNTPSVWTISVQNDGTCLIADASTGKTIKYGDGTYTTFGVYAETDSNTGVYPILVKADNPLLVELASIAVSGQTSSYEINDTFEFDGVVTATYNDGTTKTVAPTSVSSPDMTKAGNPEVTVTYIEGAITKTTTYTIFVVDPNAGDDLGIPSTTACYTLDTTNSANTGSNNSYTGNCDVNCNGIIWNVTGNATMNPWRVGGKSLTNVDRNVYTKTAYPTALSKIEFVSGTMNVSSWNSLKLQYSTNSDFSDAVTITASSVGANQTISFAPEGGFPANCYFRFVLNVTVSGSSNKYIQVNQIKFYGYEN